VTLGDAGQKLSPLPNPCWRLGLVNKVVKRIPGANCLCVLLGPLEGSTVAQTDDDGPATVLRNTNIGRVDRSTFDLIVRPVPRIDLA
jgi:hypothetical protein